VPIDFRSGSARTRYGSLQGSPDPRRGFLGGAVGEEERREGKERESSSRCPKWKVLACQLPAIILNCYRHVTALIIYEKKLFKSPATKLLCILCSCKTNSHKLTDPHSTFSENSLPLDAGSYAVIRPLSAALSDLLHVVCPSFRQQRVNRTYRSISFAELQTRWRARA